MKNCPKCGKEMQEEPNFKGLWLCPDYKNPLNDTKPFRYKCYGMEMTEEGEMSFGKALREAAFLKIRNHGRAIWLKK